MGVTGVRDWVDALRAQIWWAQGKLQQAVGWADRYPARTDDTVYPAIPVALAHIWLARGNPDEAIRCLEHALQSAQQVGRRGNTVQLLAVKALAHRARGEPTEALADLAQALALGEPEGYCRVFVDEGAPMVRLLQRAAAREPSSKYIQQLLAALGEPALDQPVAPVPLVEPLTERETQVLRLIVDGATNQEIAKELVLTVNTVKKHTSHIFAKLGVKNRAQAIGRARELNLL
jgi:LuxR family maltose regulon positive regulatory protein